MAKVIGPIPFVDGADPPGEAPRVWTAGPVPAEEFRQALGLT
jgi:hypothetical protein